MSEVINVTVTASSESVQVTGASSPSVQIVNGGGVNVAVGSVAVGGTLVTAGTVQVGAVTTLAPGSNATVTNKGTGIAAVLDFGIPAGPATNVTVGKVSTLSAGSNATVTGAANGATLTLDFGIPAGASGTNGTNGITPSFSIGTVSTLAAGSAANVTLTTANGGADVTLDFGIPAGADGVGGASLSNATPSNLGTASAGSSSLASRSDHTHTLPSLVSSVNNLTGALTLAAGSNVTLTQNGSTLTLSSSGGGLGENDAVDGDFYEGYIPANTITITTQPTPQTASGGAATFTVAASSSPAGTVSYQWQRQDGGFGVFADVSGATSATLSLSGLLNTVDDGDLYRVVVSATNAVSVNSASVRLTVPANTITITTQPTNQTASSGAATFTAAATVAPTGTPSYQWQRSNDAGVSWANVSGATSATLALTGLTVEADGGARFRVVVSATNAASVTSDSATLTVEANNTITITSQPSNQTASGGEAAFSVAATSSPGGTPTYQWQRADLTPASQSAWVSQSRPVSGAWNSVAYGGGLFMSIAPAPLTLNVIYVVTSADGVSWNSQSIGAASAEWSGGSALYSIAYGGGRFVAVSTSGVSRSSTDGQWWQAVGLPQALTATHVVYGGGKFLAISANNSNRSAVSTDGTDWVSQTIPTDVPARIGYGGGLFVYLTSTVWSGTSPDGNTWTRNPLPVSANWAGIAYGGGMFVAVDRGTGAGSNVYLTSQNGATWTQRQLPISADWRDITYGGGVFVAVSSGTPSTTLTSTDGINWTQRTLPALSGWRSVAYGNDRFVVADGNNNRVAVAAPTLGTFANVSGATSSSLALTGLTASNNGDQYRAVVSAANAAPVTSNGATLSVQDIVISSQPSDQTASGGSATFSITAAATGSAVLGYQWQASDDLGDTWTNISGATASSLTLSSLAGNADGRQYRVLVSSSGLTGVTSSTASLSVPSLLFAWGTNLQGQLGDGTQGTKTAPIQIGVSRWKRISAGYRFTHAIRDDGTLWAWGNNSGGALGDGTETARLAPVQISAASWRSVVGGNNVGAAIRSDGTLWAWGYRVGDGTTTTRLSPVQIGESTWRSVAAGWAFRSAIRDDGTLWAWGDNSAGQVKFPTSNFGEVSPVQISSDAWRSVGCGSQFTLAIKQDRTLWAWGANAYGQLGDGTTTSQGTLVQISAASWRSVVAGDYHTIAIREDGTLWTWGRNNVGQLGDGTTTDRLTPVQIGSESWVAIDAGASHSIAVRSDNTLWAWGNNNSGALGDGTETTRLAPVQIGSSIWQAVQAGNQHTIALLYSV